MDDSFGCSFRTAHRFLYSPLGNEASTIVTLAFGLVHVVAPGDYSSTLNALPVTERYKESFIS
ncbi:hypothetical protein ACGE24_00835 [Corynebacterium kroppenstedtii]|uniref:hypothetical protein n=1 Tax=Corynebacterium sp. PCR 32 TaxID=3351342 RepID=UPI00309E4135